MNDIPIITGAPTPARPEILAPAGDTPSFLAALAAGADAIYLGLKHFSARMQAENFGLTELSRLADLAHAENARIYVAMNTLVKPDEPAAAYRLISRLASQVGADGLIVQDLAMLDLARQAGFEGDLSLSTLANLTHPGALIEAKKLGANRVILPRELSIDEIRLMGEACPDGLDLELFVHGALCYCVSGRCYWSSYMGGKSGLRGRCVQPCRRVYRQGGPAAQALVRNAEREEMDRARHEQSRMDIARKDRKGNFGRDGRDSRDGRDGPGRSRNETVAFAQGRRSGRQGSMRSPGRKEHNGRWFSCLDLSLDVLAKTLLDIPHLVSWKIEGRKKGPHYVYHVVTAYRMLRDNPGDPKARKTAEEILQMALGRPVTRARFLPQKDNVPTTPDGQTNSGLMVGKIRIEQDGSVVLKPYIELLPQDYLRVGVEDERWHATLPVTRRIPKAGSLSIRLPKHKTPKAGTPVFLIDRREPELMRILKGWQARLEQLPTRQSKAVETNPRMPVPVKARPRPDMYVRSTIPQGKEMRGGKNQLQALWLSPRSADISRTMVSRICWWLPPVIWPGDEEAMRRSVGRLWREGARHFVCNEPWQRGLFPDSLDEDSDLLAGPFCNAANAPALGILARMGFTGAFVSPELPRGDMLALPKQSPLPLGAVISGFWPVGISRFGLLGVKANEPFLSPMGEPFWARQYGGNIWIYPGWPMDLTAKRQEMVAAGYGFFAHMQENPPASLPEMKRESLFNWDGSLL
ncbi:peptidase U32 family protein [Desulfovibrio intestinalis]|uniref:Putative protease n=1 Tax=Desulfovibrio intestinalis TaxID=58621 RepID=A0A7W8FEQ1_9BACT|nr:peptidase U32 family protein [Desulfovibrio intestinalis]MBB5144034.1 putative protease [Desulfovibrio intestinalis]